jgi:hypothetical protein
MSDQGEKIVNLAREMLHRERNVRNMQFGTTTLTCGTLAATTAISLVIAMGSCVYQSQNQPINKYQRVEIEALMTYVAEANKTDVSKLRQEFAKNFGVTHVDQITIREMDDVRRYFHQKLP